MDLQTRLLFFISMLCYQASNAQSKPTICQGDSVTICLDSFFLSESFCSYPQIASNLKNGLIGYWPFCGNANDVSGAGNNGVVFGATLTSDRFGNPNSAYYFNGIDNYIKCPGGNSFTSQKTTISYWININNYNATSEIICLGNSLSTSWGTVSSNTGTGLSSGIGCGATSAPSTVSTFYAPNKWYNIVLVYDKIAQNSDVYVNGIFIGSNTTSPTVNCQNSDLYFGVDIFSNPEYFTGKLDDIEIWNRLLSPSEIQQVYTQGTKSSWLDGSTTNCLTVSPSVTTYYFYTINSGIQTYIDSIKVTVIKPVFTVENKTICEGQSYKGYSTNGVYIDTLAATNGCDSIITLNLTVLLNTFSNVNATICKGENYFGYTDSGIYTDTLFAINGCDSIRTINLTVLLNSFSNLDATICKGENYLGYTASGTYTDTLVAVDGCDSIRTIRLNVLDNCEVYFPSAFTPNNDGKNDIFKALNAINLTGYVLSIYNRWGEKVFETNDFRNGWNGIFNSVQQPPGVYVWHSRFIKAGISKQMQGTVVLIR